MTAALSPGHSTKTDVVEVVESLQYVDSDDSFEREPFCILVRHKETSTVVPDFFLVGVHIRPDDAVAEINSLLDVYEQAATFFGSDNGIILGDFNADCRYLSMTQFSTLALVVDGRFTWLLDVTDTTTGNSTCAYDRIVSAGDIIDHMVPDSARVFRFDEEYSLTQTQALAVSDHYPVEVEFQGTGDYQLTQLFPGSLAPPMTTRSRSAGSVLRQSVLLWAVAAAVMSLLTL